MYPDPKFIQTVPANVDGRDFVVGDLHGCFDELAKLMTYVKFDPKRDRLFSTGDLIDRGPRSSDCLALLRKPWFYPVLGNHEDLILTKIKLKDAGQNPEFNKEELEILDIVEEYLPQLFNMPLVYEIEHLLYDKIYILHAEILPEHLLGIESETDKVEYDRYFNSMKKFDFSEPILDFFDKNRYTTLDYNLKQKIIWSRKFASVFYKDHKEKIDNGDFSFMIHEDFSQKVKIFCGHNVVPFPMKIGQQYYIDTGSALGYSSKEINSYLFTQFGHEFFALSMVDLTTGICYGCISSSNNSNYNRGQVLRLEKPIYEYNSK
jgi:hypothetical protein